MDIGIGARKGRGMWRLGAMAAAALLISPAARAQLYSESISGDLSNNPKAPTNVGTLALGANLIVGATIPSGAVVNPMTGERAVQDPDYFTFTVGAGQRLTQLIFGPGTVIDPGDRLFVGIAQGSAVNVDPSFSSAAGLLGWTLVSASMIGTNALPALGASAPADFPPIPGATGFTGSLGPGAYSLWLLDGDRPVAYSVNLVTASVPEPASWSLMIAGFGLLGGAMRRRPAPAAGLQRTAAT